MLKRLLRRPGMQAALASLLATWLRFVHRTTRWQLVLDPGAEALLRQGGAFIVAAWHERLSLLVCHWARFPDPTRRPRQPLHFVISGHRDGRIIAAVAAHHGVRSIEGSTSRGGREALARMLTLLGTGSVAVGITPDGPRGPRRIAQAGVAALARLSGRPVVCVAAAASRNRRLKSWDRMMLALPFGHGALVVGPPIAIGRGDDPQNALAMIQAGLNQVTEQADRLVGLVPG